jgi:hypothetical protein
MQWQTVIYIENNFIKKCGVGAIYLAFNNATLRGTGNIIRGNFIGSEKIVCLDGVYR